MTETDTRPVVPRPSLCVLGVDPGKTGALSFYFPEEPERVAVDDMPTVGDRIDPHALSRRIAQMKPAFAVVEQQSPRPTDGCKQSFGIGHAYAVICTTLALLNVPLHVVSSAAWKRHSKILGADDPKEAARALALRMFPASAEHFGRKKDHNRADAALIARFGADTINR